ncbi:unnamed protein product, partial [Phaeothamnion confervicola]
MANASGKGSSGALYVQAAGIDKIAANLRSLSASNGGGRSLVTATTPRQKAEVESGADFSSSYGNAQVTQDSVYGDRDGDHGGGIT